MRGLKFQILIVLAIYNMLTMRHVWSQNGTTQPSTTTPTVSYQDLFTSVHDMTALADQELRLLNTVQDYISTQQAKLRLLNVRLKQLLRVRPPEYTTREVIGDPVYAYSLVRRLTREWPLMLNLMMENIDLQEELSQLPKEHDLDSAKRGLTRLQEVYRLGTKQLTQSSENVSLTAFDCFEMGKHLLKEHKYNISELWFKESIERNAIEEDKIEEDRLLAHLYIASFLSGCDNDSRSVSDNKALDNLMIQYQNHALDTEIASIFIQALSTDCPRPGILNKSEKVKYAEFNDYTYSEACRGIGLQQSSKLRCFYIHYNNPRLLIAPFKMEELNLDPPILMFRDVIVEQEIEEMKAEFRKNHTRCKTFDRSLPYYRTCDVGWIDDGATAVSARLTRRVGDMTNMNMEMSEDNQVASYGLGGAYLLHYDYNPAHAFHRDVNGKGCRLATLMFYLNDVESGGHTVFPLINVAVKPVKGSAVFWFNIDHHSEILEPLHHGGCPVLKSSKWVMNKWIRERKQNNDMFCPSRGRFPNPRYYLNDI